ncbi:MAG TPA: hypothetical protein VLH08_01865 [Acidobacteriota bacterium]|nr:hypothetical protein [Acidobacteriota bacterium]
MFSTKRTLFLIIFLITHTANLRAENPPVPKKTRQLAIDVTEMSHGTYDDAFKIAKAVGIERVGLFLMWNVLEPSPHKFDTKFLDIAAIYYPPQHVKIDLTLAVVNTNHRVAPSDLMDRPFSDPEVIKRFKKLIDLVFSKLKPDQLASVNIGSEYDKLFGTDQKQWAQFATFYKSARDYLKLKWPSTIVATETTYEGIIGTERNTIKEINKHSDVIGISYFGIQSDISVIDPKKVHEVFDLVCLIYPGRRIYFYQFGYPTSDLLNSSPLKQKLFVEESFIGWDNHADQIQLIDYTWLHDHSPESVNEILKIYNFFIPKFRSFIATLGLRTYSGQDKPAFLSLRTAARARGW